ncbi:MAG TPA: GNAT family acetyltransferase [Gammaproteobacteria bacterium]|jgi:ribosomal protein S18 acetylase RimI-like enzyme|nr:GNAT family acetyltransferase [Gammaproteobacteria bacterium]PHS04539.1 MAG: GNAT family acetyltransferase [Acidithiobacillus sp.]RTZ64333.1 MAG: GNAT family acetyltransferase [Gammaproteobacteria bacterium]HBK78038.1 GNAT family acetyltransferase [Gammaproteobacteria bacterium]HHZ71826.1 GNAT family acetyltransferase [Gammaproteobacteria bacterium]
MKLRAYQNDDWQALIDLWQRVFPDDPPHNDPSQVISAKRAVDDLIFVALEEDSIVGAVMAGYDGHRGWLYAVAVDHPHRRHGIARRLVAHALDALRQLGCIKVNLQIRSDNAQVVAFYESLGFCVEDRISMGLHLHRSA